MANIKSALKRIKLTQRNTLRNKVSTSMMRTYIKLFITSCEEYQNSPSEDKLKSLKQDLDIACSKVDKAKNQGILHKRFTPFPVCLYGWYTRWLNLGGSWL